MSCKTRWAETRTWYELFAEYEAAGSSPTYERLARTVGGSRPLGEPLEELPAPKRQPNLLLASARLLGAPIGEPAAFVVYVMTSWDEVSAVMRKRSTQTNEPARTGTLLPVTAQIPGPMALIEVGCSAGLCLYPDHYGISYEGRPALAGAHSPVHIDVATNGSVPMPTVLPDVVARIGVDLNPLDLNDKADQTWLEALIWPEHENRLARLRSAISVVAHDPPTLSAVPTYVPTEDRRRFAEQLAQHPRSCGSPTKDRASSMGAHQRSTTATRRR